MLLTNILELKPHKWAIIRNHVPVRDQNPANPRASGVTLPRAPLSEEHSSQVTFLLSSDDFNLKLAWVPMLSRFRQLTVGQAHRAWFLLRKMVLTSTTAWAGLQSALPLLLSLQLDDEDENEQVTHQYESSSAL